MWGTVMQASEGLTEAGVSVRVVSDVGPWSRSLPWATLVRDHRGSGRERDRLIHNHGLWRLANTSASFAARSLGIPEVVSTHGMLQPEALGHRKWKKLPYWWLIEKRRIAGAAALYATAENEATTLKDLGFKNPIAIVPHGIRLPDEAQWTPQSRRENVVLFLGRLHPIKGLENLFAAWQEAGVSGWKLRLAGPDEDGYWQRLKSVATALRLDDQIAYVGEVAAQDRWKLLRNCAYLVLPSKSENFGLVVAESLACETPVIASAGTPWRILAEERCGWWVSGDVSSLAAAIREAANLSHDERQAFGQRGRALVESKYELTAVTHQVVGLYNWLLGNGDRPPFVV